MPVKKKVGPNEITIRFTEIEDGARKQTRGGAVNVVVELYRGMEKVKTLAKKLSVSGNETKAAQLILNTYGIDQDLGIRDIWTGTFHNHEYVNQGINRAAP